MVTKPTKQQIAQGKARAGGNNPVKVTKAGVKRLGQAALIAASLTPIGRTAKIAGIIAKPISKVIQAKSVKNTKVVVEKIAKMQEKAKAERIASNSVKLKLAAKNKPNPPDAKKINTKLGNTLSRAKGDEGYDLFANEWKTIPVKGKKIITQEKKLAVDKSTGKANIPLRTPEHGWETPPKTIKINSQSNLKKKQDLNVNYRTDNSKS